MPKILSRFPGYCLLEVVGSEIKDNNERQLLDFVEKATCATAVFVGLESHSLETNTAVLRFALSAKPLPFALASLDIDREEDREIARYYGETATSPYPDQLVVPQADGADS